MMGGLKFVTVVFVVVVVVFWFFFFDFWSFSDRSSPVSCLLVANYV